MARRMKTPAEKAKEAERKIIEQAYYRTCQGIQINIMDIGKVFEFGHTAIARGDAGGALDSAIHNYVLILTAPPPPRFIPHDMRGDSPGEEI